MKWLEEFLADIVTLSDFVHCDTLVILSVIALMTL